MLVAAARARGFCDEQAKERMREGGQAAGKGRPLQGVAKLPHPIPNTCKSRDAAGKAFGVGGSTVERCQTCGKPIAAGDAYCDSKCEALDIERIVVDGPRIMSNQHTS